MKKLGFLFALIATVCFYALAEDGVQKEIDYLLFLPNSNNQFADETGARTQLNNVARYLRSRPLTKAQIYVYGYTADVDNDIDPDVLSRERALYVIDELQKRGIPRDHFADPVGHGSVDLWGSNATEENRSPNRRVRILFDDVIITPEVVEEAEPEIAAAELAEVDVTADQAPEPVSEDSASEKNRNWWWWLFLLLPLLLLLWTRRKNKRSKSKPRPVAEPVPEKAKTDSKGPKYYRLTEEEIRNLAYKLFEERNCQHGYDEADWHEAIARLFVKYEAQGYIVLWP